MFSIKLLFVAIISIFLIHHCEASGDAIVAAARTQIGVPYSWGGGGYKGKSVGIESGAHTVGFDCSGLAQFSVYKGTGKIIARTAATQYADTHCKKVPYAAHLPGDLVFFNDGGSIHHVAIMTGPGTFIQAPQTGDHVREGPVTVKGRMALVARCW